MKDCLLIPHLLLLFIENLISKWNTKTNDQAVQVLSIKDKRIKIRIDSNAQNRIKVRALGDNKTEEEIIQDALEVYLNIGPAQRSPRIKYADRIRGDTDLLADFNYSEDLEKDK